MQNKDQLMPLHPGDQLIVSLHSMFFIRIFLFMSANFAAQISLSINSAEMRCFGGFLVLAYELN